MSDEKKTPTEGETKTNQQEGADPSAPKVELQEDGLEGGPDEATAAAAMDVLTQLEEALGTDAAGVLAFVEENADAIAGLASGGGAAPEGEGAGDGEAAMRRKLSTMEKLLKGQAKRIEELEQEKEQRDAAAQEATEKERKLSAEAKVDELIKARRVAPEERDSLVEMAFENPEWFDKHAATRKRLGKVMPTKRISASSKGSPDRPADDAPEVIDENLLNERGRKLFRHYKQTKLYSVAKAFELARTQSAN